MERNIRKLKAKKLNNHQRLIAAICLVVVAILVISVTFAWFTNRITLLNGKLTIGQFNYNVTVYNQNKSEEINKDFTVEDEYGATGSDFTVNNLASGSVFYKLVKITNRSSFPIKPYSYVSFNIDSQHENVPNYFYLRGIRVTEDVATAGSVSSFIDNYTLPTAAYVAEAGNSFGTANNNAVLLGTVNAGSTTSPAVEYYVVAYAVYNLPAALVNGYTLNIHPIISVSQANAPSPATTSSQVFEVDTWQAFKSAIASAKSGDSIWLTDDVIGPSYTNLALTNGVNLNLNGYDLTIHGNLSFTYPANSDMRTLNVPLSSQLRVEGDLIVETPGSPFTIAGSGSSANIILGKSGSTALGKFKAYAGLDATEGSTDPKPNSINENSGLIISDVQIKKYDDTDLVPADLEVIGSNTMVKLTSGAVLNSVTASSGIENVYLVNYGSITSVDFSGMSFGSERKVSVYVSNHNTLNSINIPSASKGSVSESASYNTRLINAPGCRTRFTQSTYAPSFLLQDVEPHSGGETTNKVVSNGNGKYTVTINTNFTGSDNISTLFTNTYGAASISDCTTMKIETNNGMELSTSNISNINSQFSNLATLDLSAAAIDSNTIPANAFSGKTSLQNVTFPVTSLAIGAGAFEGTSISKVTIPSNITSLGSNSFNVGSNVSLLEVNWKGTSAPTSAQLGAFNSNKTVMFMDASLANAITNPNNPDYTEAWKLNIYEEYQFKSGDFYCKYLADGCQIIFYSGSLSAYNTNDVSADSLIPVKLEGGGMDRLVIAVGRQAYKKAISKDNATSRVNLVFPDTCTTVENYAFQASSGSTLTANIITLNNVSSIGDSAFRYNTFLTSTARPSTFNGMTKIGSYAFAASEVNGGCFDLTCVNDRTCTPAEGAFENFTINGSSSSGNPYGTSNAYFSLANAGTIRADLATNMACYADFNLKGVGEIVANAFITATIKTNAASQMSELTTVVDVRNVLKIGHDAFKGIECGKFMIGNSSQLNADVYEEIIGQTGSNGIKTFVLDGNLCVDNNSGTNTGYYTITSKESGENVVIGTLKITTNTTCIQQGAFAGVVKKVNGQDTFSEEENIHMQIGAVSAYDSAYTERADHTYEIEAKAFYGVLFSDSVGMYNFEGANQVGDYAFSCSSITKLGLGHYITQINSPNFIAKCDNIAVLNIDYTSDSGITALLNSNVAANPNIINSSGAKQSGFTITVPNNTPSGSGNDNLLAYIADSVWSGWKNYFKPLSRTYQCNYRDNNNPNLPKNCYWEYYIIDPNDASKGVQIIGFTTTAANLSNGLYIPGSIGGRPVTEVGGEGDVFKSLNIPVYKLFFDNMSGLQYVYPDFLDTDKIRDLGSGENTSNYVVQSSILYRMYTDDDGTFYPDFSPLELVRALPNPTGIGTNVSPFENLDEAFMATISVQTEAFKNCKVYTSFTANEMLETIEAGAFDGSTIVSFNFSPATAIVKIGQNALGDCREKQLDNNGYIYYQKRSGFTITVPTGTRSEYRQLPAYFMYDKYNCIVEGSGGASVSSKNNTKLSDKLAALKLKEEAFDTTIGGINYRVMNSGTNYNGVDYVSTKTDFIAVVTSLSAETAQSKTVVIPESIVVDGVTYTVVGIDKNAFGSNNVVEKLVLPSSDIIYSSQAFANCTALGYIQFNDVAPYDATADNSVASLPVASAQSLTENSRKDDED